MDTPVLSFLQHEPQPPELYHNLPCQARSREGDVRHPTSRWLKVHTLRLERYIFLKIQAYRTQQKSSPRPEVHDCKISPGERAPRPPPSGRAPLVRRCLHHNVWKGPLSDNTTPPSKRLATGLLSAMLSALHMQWDEQHLVTGC